MKQKYWVLLGVIVVIVGTGLIKPGSLGWTHAQAQTVPTAAPTLKPGAQPTVLLAQPTQPLALIPSPTKTITTGANLTSSATPENTPAPAPTETTPSLLSEGTPAGTAAPVSFPTPTPAPIKSADSLICGVLIAGIVGLGVWGAVLNNRRQKAKKR